MNKMTADKEKNVFGALKLIEQLYLDDAIPGYVFRNILREHHDEINITDFVCYKKNDGKEKTECMD